MLPTRTFWKRFVVVRILRLALIARDISEAQRQSFIHHTFIHNTTRKTIKLAAEASKPTQRYSRIRRTSN
jgi:hypothetical protein